MKSFNFMGTGFRSVMPMNYYVIFTWIRGLLTYMNIINLQNTEFEDFHTQEIKCQMNKMISQH